MSYKVNSYYINFYFKTFLILMDMKNYKKNKLITESYTRVHKDFCEDNMHVKTVGIYDLSMEKYISELHCRCGLL